MNVAFLSEFLGYTLLSLPGRRSIIHGKEGRVYENAVGFSGESSSQYQVVPEISVGTFVESLRAYGGGLMEVGPFIWKYGTLMGLKTALDLLKFHEILYESLFWGKKLTWDLVDQDRTEELGESFLEEKSFDYGLLRGRVVGEGFEGGENFVQEEELEEFCGSVLKKSSGFLEKTTRKLDEISIWEPLVYFFRGAPRGDTSCEGLSSAQVREKVKDQEAEHERIRVASGLLRISFAAKTLWNRIPFSALFSLTVLAPVTFNIVDKYVMDRARFGRYLSNNIRLAYEDFYYTLKASPHPNPKEIYDMANHVLDVINKIDNAVPGVNIGDYGKENQQLIMRLIFAIRVFALTTLSYGILSKNLPSPDDIHKIANMMQDFMENYAWRSFVFPKSMVKIKMKVPKEYGKILEKIRSDKMLWSVFSLDCDEKCLNNLEALL